MKRVLGLFLLTVAVSCGSDRVTTTRRLGTSPEALVAADPASISLQYMCENRFRARNLNDFEVLAQWEVVGTTDTGSVMMPPRPQGRPYSDTYFDTRDSGMTKLFSVGVQVAKKPNEGKACTTRLLRMSLYEGVVGTTFEPAQPYVVGTTVRYSFQAAPGYENVIVVIDDSIAPASGSIVMNKDHDLEVAADLVLELPPNDDPLVVRMRGLLTDPDPVEAYRELLEANMSVLEDLGHEEGTRRLQLAAIAAIDPLRDSTALRRLDEALAFHTFEFELGEFVEGDGDGDDDGGGGDDQAQLRAGLPSGAAHARTVNPRGPRSPLNRSSGLLTPMPDARAALSERGSSEPTVVLYINGIKNTHAEALASTSALREVVRKAGELKLSNVRYDIWYNRTSSAQYPDYIKNREWCLADDAQSQGRRSLPSRIQRWKICTGDAVSYKIASGDFVEAKDQWDDIRANRPPRTEDSDSLSQHLTRLRAERGEHIVVVAHSQGNMMLQEALRLMKARRTFAPKTDSLCIAAVAVAAPMSDHWALDSRHLVGVLAPGDLIVLVRHDNHFTPIPTPLSIEAAAAIAAAAQNPYKGNAVYLTTDATAKEWGRKIHSFSSYLDAQSTRDSIAGGVARLHRLCTMGEIRLTPDDVTVPIQDSVRLTLTAFDRNGDVMPINHSVEWDKSSELTMRKIKTVNGTKTVTVIGRLPGTHGVLVDVIDLHDRTTIRVPPLALVLTAAETRRNHWNINEQNAPPEWPRPDPGPVPPWDGDPNHCSGETQAFAYDAVLDRHYNWSWIMGCSFGASASVEPPAGIKIARYEFEFYEHIWDGLVTRERVITPFVTIEDFPTFVPGVLEFLGFNRVVVYAFNKNGENLGRAEVCIKGDCP